MRMVLRKRLNSFTSRVILDIDLVICRSGLLFSYHLEQESRLIKLIMKSVAIVCIFLISGVKIFIDSKALMTLIGTEMDYTSDKLTSEFVFNNPNVKGTCGCGESFSV